LPTESPKRFPGFVPKETSWIVTNEMVSVSLDLPVILEYKRTREGCRIFLSSKMHAPPFKKNLRDRWAMRQHNTLANQAYLSCPRYKGRHKKHIAVCARCSWNSGCPAYRRYRQPELPFGLPAEAAARHNRLPED
jgi:hypothetical protein